MDDPIFIAIKILKVVAIGAAVVLGGYFWGRVVVAAPFRLATRLANAVWRATLKGVHDPKSAWRIWQGISMLGIVVSTLLGYWIHVLYLTGWGFLSETSGSRFVPGREWTSPFNWRAAGVGIGLFLLVAAMHVPNFRRRPAPASETEQHRRIGFAVRALTVSLALHVALVFTPLGALLTDGLNRVTNAGIALGVLLATVMVEWFVLMATRRSER